MAINQPRTKPHLNLCSLNFWWTKTIVEFNHMDFATSNILKIHKKLELFLVMARLCALLKWKCDPPLLPGFWWVGLRRYMMHFLPVVYSLPSDGFSERWRMGELQWLGSDPHPIELWSHLAGQVRCDRSPCPPGSECTQVPANGIRAVAIEGDTSWSTSYSHLRETNTRKSALTVFMAEIRTRPNYLSRQTKHNGTSVVGNITEVLHSEHRLLKSIQTMI